MRMLRGVLLITGLSVPSFANAQVAGSWTPTAAECQIAADSLAASSRDSDSWRFIRDCGAQGATATATAIAQAHAETDTLYLGDLLALAASLQHPDILATAIELAEDKNSPTVARLFALLVMLAQFGPLYDVPAAGGWSGFVNSPPCKGLIEPQPYAASFQMPSGYLASIAGSADRIADDGANGAAVRVFARCVRLMLSSEVPETVDPQFLQLEYICRNEFRITNTAGKTANLTIRVANWPDPIGIAVKANGTSTFATPVVGTVELFQGPQLLATASNAQTPCP